jgi:Flp pilus assembly protein TadB
MAEFCDDRCKLLLVLLLLAIGYPAAATRSRMLITVPITQAAHLAAANDGPGAAGASVAYQMGTFVKHFLASFSSALMWICVVLAMVCVMWLMGTRAAKKQKLSTEQLEPGEALRP